MPRILRLPADVRVRFSLAYNRERGCEEAISQAWDRLCQRQPGSFNGTKFRLLPASAEAEDGVLRLGLTDYRSFMGTNLSDPPPDDPALLAHPLGVGAVVRTADGFLVLQRRSQLVAEQAGMIDVPGGHPEPSRCPRLCEEYPDLAEAAVAAPPAAPSPQEAEEDRPDLLKELLDSARAEAVDELNLALDKLSPPLLLGVVLQAQAAGRPSLCVGLSTTQTAAEVREGYAVGGPEADESTAVLFVSEEEALAVPDLTPSARGCLELYLSRP